MSQPDDHLSLELSALRSANEVLRDETFSVLLELARQDRAYMTLVKSLRGKASDKDTTAIRAAIYTEVAQLVEDALNGASGGAA